MADIPAQDTNSSAAPAAVHQRGTAGYSAGRKIATLFVRGIPKMIVAAFIIFVVFTFLMLMQTIATAERDEADATILGAVASYGNTIKHQRCKGRGGCSHNCPFVSRSDPRVIMHAQLESMQQMADVASKTYEDELAQTDIDIASFSTSSKKTEVSDTLKALDDQRKFASYALTVLFSQTKELNNKYGSSSTLNSEVVDAGNRVTGFESIAAAYMQLIASSIMVGRSYLMKLRFNAVEPDMQKKIYHFDDKAAQCIMLANAINEVYKKQTMLLASPEVDRNLTVIASPQSNASSVVTVMATFMSMLPQMQELLTQITGKFQQVTAIYKPAMQKVEGFSNDLPGGKMDADKVSTMIESGDYNTALIKTALEPDLIANQKKFAKERSSFDSGGGVPALRDDDNDVVPWVGLFRPNYRKSDGSSVETSSVPLRSIPSDIPESLMRKNVARIQFA